MGYSKKERFEANQKYMKLLHEVTIMALASKYGFVDIKPLQEFRI